MRIARVDRRATGIAATWPRAAARPRSRPLSVSSIRGAQVEHFELFEDADVDRAFARFEEIGARDASPSASSRASAALINARDWDALA